jgi:hypothetical protein
MLFKLSRSRHGSPWQLVKSYRRRLARKLRRGKVIRNGNL